MQNTKIKRGQSLIDAVVQQTGSFTDVIQTALLNNISLSDPLDINTEINTPGITDADLVGVFSYHQPATALPKNTLSESFKGIGVMKLGQTFKIG